MYFGIEVDVRARLLKKPEPTYTKEAIEAAQKMEFVPAVKDGKAVLMWIQLEYNFLL